MMEEKYKLNILKDIVKFSKRKLTKEEMNRLLSSALFQSKNYFTSAALLIKRGRITMDEFLSLCKLKEEELSEFLEPVDNDFDYFAKVLPEEIMKAFQEMEDFLKNNPEKALENRRINKEREDKIKELYQKEIEEVKRGA